VVDALHRVAEEQQVARDHLVDGDQGRLVVLDVGRVRQADAQASLRAGLEDEVLG